MNIILNDTQFESLHALICNDPEYNDHQKSNRLSHTDPFNWIPFIKQKYKIRYNTSEDESSDIYYGSLYGTKNRIIMLLLKL